MNIVVNRPLLQTCRQASVAVPKFPLLWVHFDVYTCLRGYLTNPAQGRTEISEILNPTALYTLLCPAPPATVGRRHLRGTERFSLSTLCLRLVVGGLTRWLSVVVSSTRLRYRR